MQFVLTLENILQFMFSSWTLSFFGKYPDSFMFSKFFADDLFMVTQGQKLSEVKDLYLVEVV